MMTDYRDPGDSPDINDLGLSADLQMLRQNSVNRRRFLKMGAAALAVLLTGCAGAEPAESREIEGATSNDSGPAPETAVEEGEICVQPIPAETAGPFPADGSQPAVNALALAGIVRSDIRKSLGSGNVADGIPCQIELNLVDGRDGCTPLADYALYIWHCDREGNYSMYSQDAVGEDYLRGVQVSDSEGKLTFQSIFPSCYPGRWPHAHFEIYPSLTATADPRNVRHISQLALPEDICQDVYATEGYLPSQGYLAQLSLDTDGVFRDGVEQQMAAVSGDVQNGYVARLTIGVPT